MWAKPGTQPWPNLPHEVKPQVPPLRFHGTPGQVAPVGMTILFAIDDFTR
jgi:hypothetical protein